MKVIKLKDCHIYDPKSSEKVADVTEELHPVTERGTYYDIIQYAVVFCHPDYSHIERTFKDYQLKNFLFSTGYRIVNQPDHLLKLYMREG